MAYEKMTQETLWGLYFNYCSEMEDAFVAYDFETYLDRKEKAKEIVKYLDETYFG